MADRKREERESLSFVLRHYSFIFGRFFARHKNPSAKSNLLIRNKRYKNAIELFVTNDLCAVECSEEKCY